MLIRAGWGRAGWGKIKPKLPALHPSQKFPAPLRLLTHSLIEKKKKPRSGLIGLETTDWFEFYHSSSLELEWFGEEEEEYNIVFFFFCFLGINEG